MMNTTSRILFYCQYFFIYFFLSSILSSRWNKYTATSRFCFNTDTGEFKIAKSKLKSKRKVNKKKIILTEVTSEADVQVKNRVQSFLIFQNERCVFLHVRKDSKERYLSDSDIHLQHVSTKIKSTLNIILFILKLYFFVHLL